MTVVFDEIDAKVEGPPPPRSDEQRKQSPAQAKPICLRCELARIERRKARLKAD